MISRSMLFMAAAFSSLVAADPGQSNSTSTSTSTSTPTTTIAQRSSDDLVIQGYAAPLPMGWKRSGVGGGMRIAQFDFPAVAGAEKGELAAYFFPSGQGGSHQVNIERWVSQFTSPDGKPVVPEVSTLSHANGMVVLVELKGSYARGVGMGPIGQAKHEQTLLVAMVEMKEGRITLQAYGPTTTISAQRDNFIRFSMSFRPA